MLVMEADIGPARCFLDRLSECTLYQLSSGQDRTHTAILHGLCLLAFASRFVDSGSALFCSVQFSVCTVMEKTASRQFFYIDHYCPNLIEKILPSFGEGGDV